MDSPTRARFAWLGLLVGLSVLGRQNALLFAVPFGVAVYFALAGRLRARERAELCATFGAVVALCILPATLRNWVVSHDFVMVNSTGGIVLYTGWNPEANGVYGRAERDPARPGG